MVGEKPREGTHGGSGTGAGAREQPSSQGPGACTLLYMAGAQSPEMMRICREEGRRGGLGRRTSHGLGTRAAQRRYRRNSSVRRKVSAGFGFPFSLKGAAGAQQATAHMRIRPGPTQRQTIRRSVQVGIEPVRCNGRLRSWRGCQDSSPEPVKCSGQEPRMTVSGRLRVRVRLHLALAEVSSMGVRCSVTRP